MEQPNSVTQTLGELLLLDVFTRHGLSPDKRRELSPEQTDEIRRLVERLKSETEQFLRSGQATNTTDSIEHGGTDESKPTSPHELQNVTRIPTSVRKPRKRRLIFRNS